MAENDTVKIKHSDDHGNDHLIINRSDYDPNKHQLHEEDIPGTEASLSDEEKGILRRKEVERRAEANRGITGGPAIDTSGRNPSGTYSEPTPSDIRYPNKDETEFENNHGAFVHKSAAEMRQDHGLPDAPGGLAPDAHHVAKGPDGKYYVKKGTRHLSEPFDSEEEAKAAMPAAEERGSSEQNERSTRQRRPRRQRETGDQE
jgi:hypothetical protein